MFCLRADGTYTEVAQSTLLTGLTASLLETTLEQLSDRSNTATALWFREQIEKLK